MTNDSVVTRNFFGLPLTFFRDYSDAVAYVLKLVQANEKGFCVAVNPEKVYLVRHDPETARSIALANIGICDGIGVSLASRLLFGERLPRCTGVDFFQELIAAASTSALRVFLLGSTESTNKAARIALEVRYPSLKIVGNRDGFFDDSRPVIEEIRGARVDLLFVAFGSPKQERWIARHFDELGVPFVMGIGGTLDVVSGRIRRAPTIFRKLGIEFLYRLIVQPSRLKRHMRLPWFVLTVVLQRFRQRVWKG